MEGQQHGEQLKRGLKNRHIQLIALGGAIGTGLFLGSASVIQSAGPGIILGYAIAGFIAFLIMRQLGEMVVEEPVAGSFSHFAYKYWGSFAGFASGWNYWVLYVLVAMAELTAVGNTFSSGIRKSPTRVSAAVFFVVINAINLTNVKVFGEMGVLVCHYQSYRGGSDDHLPAAGCYSVATAARRRPLATCGIRVVSCRTASPGW